ncbi:MAG: hypothetical protein J6A82_04005 [Coprococcus sp.]|nr:hypothetical protein [Coprococcus sp.]
MNNTTKKKYETAEKMLKVKISDDEVALMTGLSLDEIRSIKSTMSHDDMFTQVTELTLDKAESED